MSVQSISASSQKKGSKLLKHNVVPSKALLYKCMCSSETVSLQFVASPARRIEKVLKIHRTLLVRDVTGRTVSLSFILQLLVCLDLDSFWTFSTFLPSRAQPFSSAMIISLSLLADWSFLLLNCSDSRYTVASMPCRSPRPEELTENSSRVCGRSSTGYVYRIIYKSNRVHYNVVSLLYYSEINTSSFSMPILDI